MEKQKQSACLASVTPQTRAWWSPLIAGGLLLGLSGCGAGGADQPAGSELASEHDIKNGNLKREIMEKTRQPFALIAESLGFAWVGGCDAPSVGGGYEAVVTPGMADTEWAPTKEAGCKQNKSARSDKRTHLRYKNWRAVDNGRTYSEPQNLDEQLVYVDTVICENPGTKAMSCQGTKTVRLSNTIAATVQEGWQFGATYTLEFSGTFLGAGAKTSLALSASRNGSASSSEQNVKEVSLTGGSTYTVEPQRFVKIDIYTKQLKRRVSFSGASKLEFDAVFDGFLAWKYNARQDFPRNRPDWTETFGDVGDIEHIIRGSMNGWSWQRLVDQGNEAMATQGFNGLKAALSEISPVPYKGYVELTDNYGLEARVAAEGDCLKAGCSSGS